MKQYAGAKFVKLWVVAMLLPMLAEVGICAEPPGKMIHAIVQMSGSDIPPDSFFNKPKVFWRASNRFCRVDEEPDPERGIHGTLLVNEPDAWLINLADNTAKHMLDPGPTYNCTLPIFAMVQDIANSTTGNHAIG